MSNNIIELNSKNLENMFKVKPLTEEELVKLSDRDFDKYIKIIAKKVVKVVFEMGNENIFKAIHHIYLRPVLDATVNRWKKNKSTEYICTHNAEGEKIRHKYELMLFKYIDKKKYKEYLEYLEKRSDSNLKTFNTLDINNKKLLQIADDAKKSMEEVNKLINNPQELTDAPVQ